MSRFLLLSLFSVLACIVPHTDVQATLVHPFQLSTGSLSGGNYTLTASGLSDPDASHLGTFTATLTVTSDQGDVTLNPSGSNGLGVVGVDGNGVNSFLNGSAEQLNFTISFTGPGKLTGFKDFTLNTFFNNDAGQYKDGDAADLANITNLTNYSKTLSGTGTGTLSVLATSGSFLVSNVTANFVAVPESSAFYSVGLIGLLGGIYCWTRTPRN